MADLKGKLILAKDEYYDTDDFKTRLNNNILVIGSSGCGKTRGIVEPNILQAEDNYIILDPKGNLNKKYSKYLILKGYEVETLDFIHPEKSVKYNFFEYIKSEQDILKIAHILMNSKGQPSIKNDPFWDEAAELLISSMIAYLIENVSIESRNMKGLLQLITYCTPTYYDKSPVDDLMSDLEKKNKDSFALKQYKKFKACAEKTYLSIMITVNAMIGKYDTHELNQMLAKDEINLTSFADGKKVLFVIVSDTDRSMDGLVNLFFSQTMDILCRYADEETLNSRLPRNVRFIMDDFGTNCKIVNFEKMISNIRSRGISTMLMLQAEAQLYSAYGSDAETIIANCDTYVYMGGNDIMTAKSVAERWNKPYSKVLNMPIGKSVIFRRGSEPRFCENFVLEDYEKIKTVAETER